MTAPAHEKVLDAVVAPDHVVTAADPVIAAPEPDTAHRRSVRWKSAVLTVLPPLVVAGVVVGLWSFITYVVLAPRRRFLMPPPQDVVQEGFLDRDNLSDILHALWSSAQVAFVGLAVAIVIGTAFAVAMSQARWVERSFYPWAVVLQTVPILALVPLIGFWFKFGFGSRVLVCVIIALFPIVTNTLFGLKSAERSHHDLLSLYGASRGSGSCTSSSRAPCRRSSPGGGSPRASPSSEPSSATSSSARASRGSAVSSTATRSGSVRRALRRDHLLVTSRAGRLLALRAPVPGRRRLVARIGPTRGVRLTPRSTNTPHAQPQPPHPSRKETRP